MSADDLRREVELASADADVLAKLDRADLVELIELLRIGNRDGQGGMVIIGEVEG